MERLLRQFQRKFLSIAKFTWTVLWYEKHIWFEFVLTKFQLKKPRPRVFIHYKKKMFLAKLSFEPDSKGRRNLFAVLQAMGVPSVVPIVRTSKWFILCLYVIRIPWITLLKASCCSQTTACTRRCWRRLQKTAGNVYIS